MTGLSLSGRHAVGFSVAGLVLILDQLSKWVASRELPMRVIELLPNFFDLQLVHNAGAAFGLFAGWAPLWRLGLLTGVALVATGFVVLLLHRTQLLWNVLALGLVLGGAVGNLIDRIRFGWVVDFIHLHWHDLSWPVFNLADSAISVGVVMLLFEGFKKTKVEEV